MGHRVVLTFIVDGDEDAAWDIADQLEQSAIKRNFREVNGYVEQTGRAGVLGPEGAPVTSSAETIERKTSGGGPAQLGLSGGEMITLGGEHGESRG